MTFFPTFESLSLFIYLTHNIYFVFGIFIAFIIKFFNIYHQKLKEYSLLTLFFYILLIFSTTILFVREFILDEMIFKFFQLNILIMVMYIIYDLVENKKEQNFFPKINIMSFLMPILFIIYLLTPSLMFIYFISFLFLVLILINTQIQTEIQISLYYLYLTLFIFLFFLLNLNLVAFSQKYLMDFFTKSFTDFITGLIFGFVFFIIIVYLFFLATFRTKEKHLDNFILSNFSNNINKVYSILILISFNLILSLNDILDLPLIIIFMILFLFNDLIFHITKENHYSSN